MHGTKHWVALATLLLLGLATLPGIAATEEDIETSLVSGIAWLADQQNVDGSWGITERVAHTGLAVMKLEDRAFELGMDPFDTDYAYSANVVAGLGYILANASIVPIAVQAAGDPDANGNGQGVCICDSYHRTYSTGISLMALAGSRAPSRLVGAGPLAGWTYGAVVQDAVDYLAFIQNDLGTPRGGWGYGSTSGDEGWADNSNSGYAVLGLDFARAPSFGFSATVPAFVLSELNVWIDYIQNDVDGDSDDGGSGYSSPTYWVNVLKTGNLIYQMAFVGDDPTTPRVLDALDYVARHWNDSNADPGFRPHHYQAMYCLMKGLERMGVDLLDLDADDVPEHDWFDEVSTIIVDSQKEDGSWPSDYWADALLSTAWALLTLERVAPPAQVTVPLDVKPGSCPNPLNVRDNGVLPVAILGSADLDVTTIDPATLLLEGVAPSGWAYEDVAAPYAGGFGDPPSRTDCWTAGPDGYLDLTLKFDLQAIVEALGDVADGDVLVLTLTGQLTEDAGGYDILGQDVVWIRKKGK